MQTAGGRVNATQPDDVCADVIRLADQIARVRIVVFAGILAEELDARRGGSYPGKNGGQLIETSESDVPALSLHEATERQRGGRPTEGAGLASNVKEAATSE